MTARDRKTAIFGAIAMMLLVAIGRGVPVLREWQTRAIADATDVTRQIASAREAATTLPALRDSLHARRTRLAALDSVLLRGASSSAAAAELASLVDDLAADSRLRVTAMQLRADSAPPGSLAQVGVRLTGIADVTGMSAFLHAVESDDTPLVVRELGVTQSEPTAPDSRVEALRVDVLVVGLARIAPPKT